MGKILVIFDCDGTLVDTEFLNCKVCSEMAVEAGVESCTPKYVMDKFKGINLDKMFKLLKLEHGIEIPENIEDKFVKIVDDLRDEYQKDLPNVYDVVKNLSEDDAFEICVASNGEKLNVIASLKKAGLYQFFDENRIFTAEDVANPKPAPDLFLHVAQIMGVDPSNSFVVEDTDVGVLAAVAAGIKVFGFTGAVEGESNKVEIANSLKNSGAINVFDDFIHIIDCFKPLKNIEDRYVS